MWIAQYTCSWCLRENTLWKNSPPCSCINFDLPTTQNKFLAHVLSVPLLATCKENLSFGTDAVIAGLHFASDGQHIVFLLSQDVSKRVQVKEAVWMQNIHENQKGDSYDENSQHETSVGHKHVS